MNRRLVVLFFAMFLMITNAFAQRADFSGKWKIDESKSDFGKNTPMAAIQELTVTDKQDSILIEGGLFNKPLPYSGKMVEMMVDLKAKRTKMIFQYKVKHDDNRNSIIIVRKQINDSPDAIMTVDGVQVWSLSADQTELIIKDTSTIKGDKPEMMNLVYTRQQ